MTNETFSVLTDEDKNTKLRTVLRKVTKDSLTEDELSAILCGISLNRQYSVRVSSNPDEFRAKLILADAGSKIVLGGIIAGMPGTSEYMFRENHASVYIAKGDTDSINIYVPKERSQKGSIVNEKENCP